MCRACRIRQRLGSRGGPLASSVELACSHVPRILLVDGDRRRRALVSSTFRKLGCHVIETCSPLEAIGELAEARLHLWAVVIADTIPAAQADELRRFLRETYPALPLIDVGPGAGATLGLVDPVA